eukprot:UN01542
MKQDRNNTFVGHFGCVNCAAWDHQGRYLATGSDDKVVKIWDAFAPVHRRNEKSQQSQYSQGRCLYSLKGHQSNVFCVKFMFVNMVAGKQNRVVSGSNDANVP